VLILKIYYFDIFSSEKNFKKNHIPQSQTRPQTRPQSRAKFVACALMRANQIFFLEVIIFGSVFTYKNQPNQIILKKNRNRVKPTSFGSVWFGF
jgi:hypothetical protein